MDYFILPVSSECYETVCQWTGWEDDENGGKVDLSKPTEEEKIGDIQDLYPDICGEPIDIECRIQSMPDYPFEDITGQEVCCDLDRGLVCENRLYAGIICYNYEVRIKCCKKVPCGTTPQVTTTSVPTTTHTVTTTIPTTTTAITTTTAPTSTTGATSATTTLTTFSESTTVPKTSTPTEATSTVLTSTHGTTRKYGVTMLP